MATTVPTFWSEDEDKLLRKRVKDGYSASRIAAELEGRSRNAVIARTHRLRIATGGQPKHDTRRRGPKLPLKPSRTHEKRSYGFALHKQINLWMARHEDKPVPVEPVVVPGEEPTPLLLSLLELSPRSCRWPHGDPHDENFGFCGHVSIFGSSYCPYHYAKSIGKPQRKHT